MNDVRSLVAWLSLLIVAGRTSFSLTSTAIISFLKAVQIWIAVSQCSSWPVARWLKLLNIYILSRILMSTWLLSQLVDCSFYYCCGERENLFMLLLPYQQVISLEHSAKLWGLLTVESRQIPNMAEVYPAWGGGQAVLIFSSEALRFSTEVTKRWVINMKKPLTSFLPRVLIIDQMGKSPFVVPTPENYLVLVSSKEHVKEILEAPESDLSLQAVVNDVSGSEISRPAVNIAKGCIHTDLQAPVYYGWLHDTAWCIYDPKHSPSGAANTVDIESSNIATCTTI